MMNFELHAAGNASEETLLGRFDEFVDAREAFDATPVAWAIIPTGHNDELEMFGNLYSIAPRYIEGCYVLRSGKGFSCLGFRVADRKGRAVAAWAGVSFGAAELGTPEHFGCYVAAMAAGAAKHAATKQRCPAELISELVPYEGKRVRVTYPDGSAEKFRVGKSSGWMPCHLEMRGRDSGGPAVYFPQGATVELA